MTLVTHSVGSYCMQPGRGSDTGKPDGKLRLSQSDAEGQRISRVSCVRCLEPWPGLHDTAVLRPAPEENWVPQSDRCPSTSTAEWTGGCPCTASTHVSGTYEAFQTDHVGSEAGCWEQAFVWPSRSVRPPLAHTPLLLTPPGVQFGAQLLAPVCR